MTTLKQIWMEPRVRPRLRSGRSRNVSSSPKRQNENVVTKSEPNTKSVKVQTLIPRQESDNDKYNPLKELLLNDNGKKDDARIQFLNPRLKFRETRLNVKNKNKNKFNVGSDRLGWELVFPRDPFPWEKYENSQNMKNYNDDVENKWNFPKDLRYDLTPYQDELPRQNLNAIYNRYYDSEPRVLGIKKSLTEVLVPNNDVLTPLLADTGKSLTEQVTSDLDLKFSEIMAVKNPTTKSILINKNIRREIQNKSVTFTPDTLFPERNPESTFWMNLNYQQLVRKLYRQRQANVKNHNGNIKASHSVAPSENIEPVSKPGYRQRKKPIGFWRGVSQAIAFICGRGQQLSKTHQHHRCHRPL